MHNVVVLVYRLASLMVVVVFWFNAKEDDHDDLVLKLMLLLCLKTDLRRERSLPTETETAAAA